MLFVPRLTCDLQAKAAAQGAWDKAKAINEEHKIVEKASDVAKTSWDKAKEFDKKHDVNGKIGRGLLAGFNKVTGVRVCV